MSKPTINYLFHVPHMKKMLDYDGLENLVHRGKRIPNIVHVIDASTNPRKRLGAVPPHLALLKFR